MPQGSCGMCLHAVLSLQTRILELEGRVRRAAAERGAVELKKNEFQGELEKQRGQLDKIQSSHNFQLESISKMCQDEKARPLPFHTPWCIPGVAADLAAPVSLPQCGPGSPVRLVTTPCAVAVM